MKHIIRYLLNGVFIKAIGLISLPFYTYLLSPSDYGLYAILMSYISLGGVVLCLNLHSSVARFYYDDGVDLEAFLSSTVWLMSFVFLIFYSFFYLLDPDSLSDILGFNFSKYGQVILFVVAAQIFFGVYAQTLIPMKKSKEYSLVTGLKSMTTVLFGLAFFIVGGDVLYLLYGVLVSESIFFVFAFFKIRSSLKLTIKLNCVKYIFGYSVFLLPYSLSGFILSQIDRIMLSKYDSIESTGIYSVAYAISMIPWTIFVMFSKGWTPDYFSHMNNKNYSLLDRDVNYILLFSSLLVIFLMLFLGDISQLFLNERYDAVSELMPILLSSTLYIILWQMWGRGIGYSKKTIYTSIIGIFCALINVLLNHFLIPSHGVFGAAYATLSSYFIMAFLGYAVSKYLLGIYTVSLHKMKPFLVSLLSVLFILVMPENYLFYFKFLYLLFVLITVFLYRKKIKMFLQSKVKF